MIAKFSQLRRTINFNRRGTLLRKDFLILFFALNRNLKVSIETNGLLLNTNLMNQVSFL